MRNLGLIISFWLSAILIPANSFALGLGDISVNSFLNQPLKAEIEVISARAGEIDDLLVGLASRDAFTRAGLSRPNNLSDLRFTVQKSEEGDSAVILVTTRSAIKEPFLNFLVEADWSKGRVLREFTILLDPPFYADSPAPAPQPEPEAIQPVTEIAQVEPEVPTPIVESESTESSSTFEQQTITEPIALSGEDQNTQETVSQSSNVGSIMTTSDVSIEKGDTLWSIASGLQDSGYSINQIMLPIKRANPDAFGDDNINNLKAGSVLRLPDSIEIGDIDQQEAYAQVLEQNGLWDDYVARVTGQTAVAAESKTSGLSVDSDTPEQTAELNLVTPGDGQSDAAGLQSEGEDANELRVKLALAEEELDASRVENTELESSIAELEARLSKFEELQKMVEIEDDSLAKIQENQVQENEAIISNEALNEEQQTADEDALLEEILPADATTEVEESPDEMVDDAIIEEATTETITTVIEQSDSLSDDNLVTEQTNETPPVPVIVTEPVQEPSLLDDLLPEDVLDMLPDVSGIIPSIDSLTLDPIMLGGLGGILLLLIGLFIYKRKKSDDSDDEVIVNDPIFALDGDDEEEELTPIHLAEGAFEGLEDDGTDISLAGDTELPTSMQEEDEEDVEDDFSKTAVISQEEMPSPEPEAPAVEEQDDILNEADVYLAYNLYDNAEELLTSSLETNPERADYRSKLLDTHFATKNADAFVREAEALKSMGSPANRYWDRVMVMGFELAPDNALFADAKDSGMSAADLEFSKPASADFDLGADDDDTNFSTTDFDLGEEDTNTFEATDFSSGDIGADTETPEPEFDALLDLSDEDITSLPEMDDSDEVPDDIGDLDFSFGDSEGEEALVEVDIDDDDENLDFGLPDDLDLGSDTPDSESTAVLEAGTAVIDTSAYISEFEDEDNMEIEATSVLEAGDVTELGDGIDFGMEDTAMIEALDDDTDDVVLNLGDFDDNDSQSVDDDIAAEKTDTFPPPGRMDDNDSLSTDVDMSADSPKTDTFAPGDFDDPDELAAMEADFSSAGLDDIEDLMLPDDVDEVATKLDLARAFIDMGDAEGARSSLDEVMAEGNDEQKAEARALIDQL